ncbi:MAG: hypothetical protein QOJ99_6146, partial [Bryobacterales bacterium]|nr:hypothetical protein [Bryobacterales bacterium]
EHIQQLHEAESALPPNQQTGVDISTIKTEGDAGDYIERVTALLHPKVAGGAAR